MQGSSQISKIIDDSKYTQIWLWAPLTFLLAFFLKIFLINFSLFPHYFLYEFLIFLILLFLSVSYGRVINIIRGTVAGVIIFLYWLDINVMSAIDHRLTLDGFLSNYSHLGGILPFINYKVIILLSVLILAAFFLRSLSIKIRVNKFYIYIGIIAVCLLTILIANTIIVEEKYFWSFTKINVSPKVKKVLPLSWSYVRKKYPVFYKKYLKYNFSASKNLISKKTNRPNLIVVVSEALQKIDSHYSDGLFNRFPNIDHIQAEGLSLSNAVSNGTGSLQALASLFLGIQTIRMHPADDMSAEYPQQYYPQRNIIRYAVENGYHTVFFMPTDAWMGLHQWVKQLGFNEVYHLNSSVYKGLKRYTWDFVDDRAVFNTVLKKMKELPQPYLIVIETASLHKPYILPDDQYKLGGSKMNDLINYVDHTTYEFYDALKNQGFFNSGLMLLVGDHHRFGKLEPMAEEHGGPTRWNGRVIASFVGKGVPKGLKMDEPVNFPDLNRVLHRLVEGEPFTKELLINSNLAAQLGIEIPFSVHLAGPKNAIYLIRSDQYDPMYVSIYGDIPFDEIPNEDYRKIVAYLILNHLWIKDAQTEYKDKRSHQDNYRHFLRDF